MRRFIHKRINDKTLSNKKCVTSLRFKKEEEIIESVEVKEEILPIDVKDEILPVEENNEDIKEEIVMDTKEKIQMAAAVLNAEQPKVKKVKKDKGLIERTESSITILTEDNRELLKD